MEEEDEEEIRLDNHFSLWRRKMRKSTGLLTTFLMDEVDEEGRVFLVNHFSLWRRKMRTRSGLLTTFLSGGER